MGIGSKVLRGLACLVSVALALPLQALTSEVVRQPHIRASLVSQADSLQPGSATRVGLLLQPDEHWHVYWRNPGDSGMPPSLQWQLPAGVEAGAIEWPFPEQIPVQHLMNFGYSDDVLLPVPLAVAGSVKGDTAVLSLRASWLVCRETCVPGTAQLRLSLPLSAAPAGLDAERAALFERALARQPRPLPLLGASAEVGSDTVAIDVFAAEPVFRQAQRLEFIPATEGLVEYGQAAQLRWRDNLVQIRQARSLTYTGLPQAVEGLLIVDRQQAWRVSFTP